MQNRTSTSDRPSTAAPSSTPGGRILVDELRVHGVDRIFCVPGESYLDVLDALCDAPEIELIVARHEGGAANMAVADGKLTGRPGICIVTRGPGATHASVGVHTAFQDSTPMILLIGQVNRRHRGREAFQEVEYRTMFAPMAKWVAEIDCAERIPEYIHRAFQVAVNGRRGPVVLVLPEDVLEEAAVAVASLPTEVIELSPSRRQMVLVEQALAVAQRPLAILGGSGWSEEACAQLTTFCEQNALPVYCSFRCQDLFDNRHPNYAGHLSLGMPPFIKQRLEDADFILAIGTRLADIETDAYKLLQNADRSATLIHVHPDVNELGSVSQPTLAIAANPVEFVEALSQLTSVTNATWAAWTREAAAFYREFSKPTRPPLTNFVDMAYVVNYLSETLPEDAILSNGAGNYTIWLHRFFRYRNFHTQLAPQSGAMGFGLPAAIAAKARFAEKLSLCFAGDGCFLMYPQELATAMQSNLPVITLLINNGMYGTIRMHQEKRFPGRTIGTDLVNPDFVALAQSFGAFAKRVERTEQFAPALEEAIASGRAAVLELIVDPAQITPDMRLSS
jgi:acetolactate synthase-1/2/3 large subunit